MNEFDLAWSVLKGLPEQQMDEGGYARVQRRGSLPKQIDMSMRGIGPARMKNFGQEINELADNYDIDEMMNRNASMEAAESEAQEEEDSRLSRGQMPPEQYNIWRERMHSMMPQKPAPGKEFENRRSWSYHSGRGERTPLSRDVQGQEKLSDEEAFYSDLDWPKRGARVITGEPMDIAFQLLKDSAKARDGSPFAFPKRDDPNYNPYDQMSQDLSNYPKPRYGDYLKRKANKPLPDYITQQRMNPMSKVNPNVPEHFQPPPPPPMDPSWTPEAIARINAQNDKARKELSGEGGGY
jgi:FtsZ-binding cell division protein ZapB